MSLVDRKHYEVLKYLGGGDFETVFLARVNNTSVAIRTLFSHIKDQENLRNIARHVVILKLIDHPNIVKFHDYFIEDFQHHLVTEFIDGSPVSSQIPEGGFPELQAYPILHQALLAIEYIHSRGIIHRDIKASNLLVTDSNVVKLIDFGSAVFIDEESKFKKIESYYWRAPETYNGPFTTKSDIWSYGITVIELLEGAPPNRKLRFDTAAILVVTKAAPTLNKARSYSELFRNLVSSTLIKDPKKRFSATEILREYPCL